MIDRVVCLRDSTVNGVYSADLLQQIDNALTDGYARALAGDAWSMRTEDRLHHLLSDTDVPVRGRELRGLASEHASFQRELIALRSALAELRSNRERLRAAAHATSA